VTEEEEYFEGAMEVRDRLADGQKFNAYERADGDGYTVALGPISGFLFLASCDWPEDADLIVDALRHRFGQKPTLSRLSERAA
jgi:hypothetical protein